MFKDNIKKRNDKGKSADSSTTDLDLESQLKELTTIIDKVEDEKLEIQNKLKKALADYMNLERGIDIRVENKLSNLKRKLAASIIEIIDDIKFGIDAAEKIEVSDEAKAWLDGVTGTLGKMEKAIGELGITLIDVKVGDTFNSEQHEAIGGVPGGAENSIAQVVQPGYLMGESVVRPARVIVFKSN